MRRNCASSGTNASVIKIKVEFYFDQVPLAVAGQTSEAIDEGQLQQCRHARSAEACGGASLKNGRSVAIRSYGKSALEALLFYSIQHRSGGYGTLGATDVAGIRHRF